jgi:hypothetical protein
MHCSLLVRAQLHQHIASNLPRAAPCHSVRIPLVHVHPRGHQPPHLRHIAAVPPPSLPLLAAAARRTRVRLRRGRSRLHTPARRLKCTLAGRPRCVPAASTPAPPDAGRAGCGPAKGHVATPTHSSHLRHRVQHSRCWKAGRARAGSGAPHLLVAILDIATAYVSIGVQRQCRYGVLPPAAGVLRYISTSSSRISLSGSTSVSVPSNANVSNLCSVSE